jgi:glutamine amidotransferase
MHSFTNPAVTLVNYGLGNITALYNIFLRLNIPVQIASTPDELTSASRLILPGVGSFDWAMTKLNASGLRPCLDELVLSRHCPILGICVGLQMMALNSQEGILPGLGWLDAEVAPLCDLATANNSFPPLAVPHMGWNNVDPVGHHPLFYGLLQPFFYFLHSFYLVPGPSLQTLATVDYGGSFTCAAASSNVMGVQFHPEKSHDWGISLLKNFSVI